MNWDRAIHSASVHRMICSFKICMGSKIDEIMKIRF